MSTAGSESDTSNSGFETPSRIKRHRNTPPTDNPKRRLPEHIKNTVRFGKKGQSPLTTTANKFAALQVKSSSSENAESSDYLSDNSQPPTPIDLYKTPTAESSVMALNHQNTMETDNSAEPTIKDVVQLLNQQNANLMQIINQQSTQIQSHEVKIEQAHKKVPVL